MRLLRVVAVSGGLQPSSKSTVLATHLLNLASQQFPCETRLISVGQMTPLLAGTTWRAQLPDTVEQAIAEVEQADVLIVVTPVFRGAYTGIFKHFFDFIHQDALVDKPVLLAATGGSQRHALMIDHQLRPLFSFFQARTLPLGVYATDQDFEGACLRDDAVLERAEQAMQRASPVIELTYRATQAIHAQGFAEA